MLGSIIATALAAATSQFCILSVEEQASTLAIMTQYGAVKARVEIGKMPHEMTSRLTVEPRSSPNSGLPITTAASERPAIM